MASSCFLLQFLLLQVSRATSVAEDAVSCVGESCTASMHQSLLQVVRDQKSKSLPFQENLDELDSAFKSAFRGLDSVDEADWIGSAAHKKAKEHAAMEKRINPEDGKAYTLAELVRHYDSFPRSTIEAFFWEKCHPVSAEAVPMPAGMPLKVPQGMQVVSSTQRSADPTGEGVQVKPLIKLDLPNMNHEDPTGEAFLNGDDLFDLDEALREVARHNTQVKQDFCRDYCSTTGCYWTNKYSCPWAAGDGTVGRARDDGSLGYLCCCTVTTADSQLCGGFLAASVCKDSDSKCADWARTGECTTNPNWMLVNCRKSCGQCDQTNTTTLAATQTSTTTTTTMKTTPMMATTTEAKIVQDEWPSTTSPTRGGPCAPVCKWSCSLPACEEVCKPECELPKCETRCSTVDLRGCKLECNEPECGTICPKTPCPLAGSDGGGRDGKGGKGGKRGKSRCRCKPRCECCDDHRGCSHEHRDRCDCNNNNDNCNDNDNDDTNNDNDFNDNDDCDENNDNNDDNDDENNDNNNNDNAGATTTPAKPSTIPHTVSPEQAADMIPALIVAKTPAMSTAFVEKLASSTRKTRKGCPKCTTKCGNPICKLKCPQDQNCKSLCESPKCKWNCKAPEVCPKPDCRLVCEQPPQECANTIHKKLPKLKKGELKVATFTPKMNLLQTASGVRNSTKVHRRKDELLKVAVESLDGATVMEFPIA